MVLSAHAHLYQRITYQHADGREIPYMIVGSGGHPPVENLFETCTKGELERRPPPLDLVLPPGSDPPNGDTAKVVAYNDTDFGFARITVVNQAVNCQATIIQSLRDIAVSPIRPFAVSPFRHVALSSRSPRTP
ncbi:MAG TPA: hypothetical protein VE641_16515 [Chthoniobacterales bacterium]|nr:hypothetical protein [Chthoniobacterales bacterium]